VHEKETFGPKNKQCGPKQARFFLQGQICHQNSTYVALKRKDVALKRKVSPYKVQFCPEKENV
jgi:hypothetical protein